MKRLILVFTYGMMYGLLWLILGGIAYAVVGHGAELTCAGVMLACWMVSCFVGIDWIDQREVR